MDTRDFEIIVDHQFTYCRNVLIEKADEYAPGNDRLSNFKSAASLQGISPIEALRGMMSKHIVAIMDFIEKDEKNYKRWEEKITDSINYLLLLDALIRERDGFVSPADNENTRQTAQD